MPVDVMRLFDSDLWALSTGEEFKAAFALWGRSFFQVPAASLPDDDRILAHLSCAGGRWPKVKEAALRGWVKCSDGRLYHRVVAEKANEAWASRRSYRDRSRKGNTARWGPNGSGSGIPQGSQNDPSAIPKRSLQPPKGQVKRQGQGVSLSLNPSPSPGEGLERDSVAKQLRRKKLAPQAALSQIRKDWNLPSLADLDRMADEDNAKAVAAAQERLQ